MYCIDFIASTLRAWLVTLLVLVAALASAQSLALSRGGSAPSPSQYADTQIAYAISLSGADKSTLSIDGGTASEFSNTKTVFLDGSQPHHFQVLQMICQTGWECGNQVSDWRNGKRLYASQWTWTVPAGTVETRTFTETYYDYEFVCTSYDPHTGSCDGGYTMTVPYTQLVTKETFTPPCTPCKFTFQYISQYRLVVQDNFGPAGGLYAWYDSCTSVQLPSPSGYSALGHSDTVAGSPGVRYVFNGWAIDGSGSTANEVTMCAPHLATSTYVTQYQLQVTSQCPALNPKGTGWYPEGATATVQVDSQAPIVDWLGQLGGKYVFNGWLGVPSMTSPSAQVVMKQPQTYTAACRADYTTPGAILIPAITATCGCGYYVTRKKRKKSPWLHNWWGLGRKGSGKPGHPIGTGSTRTSYFGPHGTKWTYSQPSTPPGQTGEPPSPITPGGQSTGGPGIQSGQPIQQNPPSQKVRIETWRRLGWKRGQPSRVLDSPQTQQGPGSQPSGQQPTGVQATSVRHPGRPGIRPPPGSQPTDGVKTAQPAQPSQPKIQPGGQSTPSLKPGVEQTTPRIGPGEQPKIGPGLQPRTPGSHPPSTTAPAPLAPFPGGTEYCAHCGEGIPVKSKYCPFCGLAQS